MNDNGKKLTSLDLDGGTSPANAADAKEGAYNDHIDELHDLFAASPAASGSSEEDPLAELRNDPNYSALIRDLEYIATQARLLFEPAQEAPSDEVWNKIQSQLSNESNRS